MPTAEEPPDVLSSGIRVSIDVPLEVLRTSVATGNFPGLASVLEICELFDTIGENENDD
ncbi:hypothetical protein [Kribbella steppae]|uniref:hypothetical protein n=1 Tax=Kribbella steppae TaxID=2512223 RepID=UPI00130D9402|nr:hypothetical protein [Kribbella steppae]